MASGEIRLTSTTMRRMTVLAQSGDPIGAIVVTATSLVATATQYVQSGLQYTAGAANYATVAQGIASSFPVSKSVAAFNAALNKITGVADALNDDIEDDTLGLEMSLLTAVADADVPYAAAQLLYQVVLVPLGNDLQRMINELNRQMLDLITDPDPITGPQPVFTH